mgnify:CR=1 FL=1
MLFTLGVNFSTLSTLQGPFFGNPPIFQYFKDMKGYIVFFCKLHRFILLILRDPVTIGLERVITTWLNRIFLGFVYSNTLLSLGYNVLFQMDSQEVSLI